MRDQIFRRAVFTSVTVKILESEIIGKPLSSFLLTSLVVLLLFTSIFILDISGEEMSVPDSVLATSSVGLSVQDNIDESEGRQVNSSWFHWGRVNVLAIIAIFFLFVLLVTNWAQKGKKLLVREIPSIQAIEKLIKQASKLKRPIVYVPGVFDVDNIQTIASMAILVRVAKTAAEHNVRLIIPLNRAFLIPLAEESVKRGMDEAGKTEFYDPDNIRYFSDEQFAYAAAVDGLLLREKPAATFYLGGFGAESLILAEMGHNAGAIQIAGTAETQQLPFLVAACDYTLIGEEFYAASAYISKEPKLLGSLKAADVVKAVMIVILLIGSILELLGIHTMSGWFVVQ